MYANYNGKQQESREKINSPFYKLEHWLLICLNSGLQTKETF